MASPKTGDDEEKDFGLSLEEVLNLKDRNSNTGETIYSESVTECNDKINDRSPTQLGCSVGLSKNNDIHLRNDEKDSLKINSDLCDTKESTTSSLCDAKESTTSYLCDTKESATSDLCDTKGRTTSDLCDTKESTTTDLCDTKESTTSNLCDTKESTTTDLCKTKESSTTDLCENKQSSTTDLCENKQSSTTDLCETKQSSTNVLEGTRVTEEDTCSVGFDFCFNEEGAVKSDTGKLSQDSVGQVIIHCTESESGTNSCVHNKNYEKVSSITELEDMTISGVLSLSHLVSKKTEGIIKSSEQHKTRFGNFSSESAIRSVNPDQNKSDCSAQIAHGLCRKTNPKNLKAKRLKLDALVENIKSLKAAELNKTDEQYTLSVVCDTPYSSGNSCIKANDSVGKFSTDIPLSSTGNTTCVTKVKNSKNLFDGNLHSHLDSGDRDEIKISKIQTSKFFDCGTGKNCDTFTKLENKHSNNTPNSRSEEANSNTPSNRSEEASGDAPRSEEASGNTPRSEESSSSVEIKQELSVLDQSTTDEVQIGQSTLVVTEFKQREDLKQHDKKTEWKSVKKFDSFKTTSFDLKSLSFDNGSNIETAKITKFDNQFDRKTKTISSCGEKTVNKETTADSVTEELNCEVEHKYEWENKSFETTIKTEVVKRVLDDSIETDTVDCKLIEPVGKSKLLKSPVFQLEGQKDKKFGEFSNVIGKKQPVVFLGERVSRKCTLDETSALTTKKCTVSETSALTTKKCTLDETSALSKLANVKQKKPVKKIEMIRHPCRRIKRVASLNALAMVNILFGKDESPPKSQKSGDVKSNSKKVITNKSLSKAKLLLEAKVKSLLKKAKTEEHPTKIRKTSPQKISQIEKSLAKLSLESPKRGKPSKSEDLSRSTAREKKDPSKKATSRASKKESPKSQNKEPLKSSTKDVKLSTKCPKSKVVSNSPVKSPTKESVLSAKVQSLPKSSTKFSTVKQSSSSGPRSPVKGPSAKLSLSKVVEKKSGKKTKSEKIPSLKEKKNKSDKAMKQNNEKALKDCESGEKKNRKKKGELMRAARTHTFPEPKSVVRESSQEESKCENCLKRPSSHSKTDTSHRHDGSMTESNVQYNMSHMDNGSYASRGYGVLPGNCVHCSQSGSLYSTQGASGFIIGQPGGLVSPCLTIGPVVQYHPFSAGYPLQYPSSHCGCPSCYYYTPTTSPLHHDTCHHSVPQYDMSRHKDSGDNGPIEPEIDVVGDNSRDVTQPSSFLYNKASDDGDYEIDVVGGVPPLNFSVSLESPKKKKKKDLEKKLSFKETEKIQEKKKGKQANCDKENTDKFCKKTKDEKNTIKKAKKFRSDTVDNLSQIGKKRTLSISSDEVKAKKKKLSGENSVEIKHKKKKEIGSQNGSNVVTNKTIGEKKNRSNESHSKVNVKCSHDNEIKVTRKKKNSATESDISNDTKTSVQINQSKSDQKKSPITKQNGLSGKVKSKSPLCGSKDDKKSAKFKNDDCKKGKTTINRSKSVDAKETKKDHSKKDIFKRSESLDPKLSKQEIAKTYPKRKRTSSLTRQISAEYVPKKKSTIPTVSKEKMKKVETKKVKKRNHSWEFNSKAEKRKILVSGSLVERFCYPAIQHNDGDIINIRDVVILRSGPRKTDIPYLAKVTAFWEENDEMMMSLLWYYHPEHTDTGRQSHHLHNEIFASKHRDENSVACIDDKGYVLTYNELCRYRAEKCRVESNLPPRLMVVPALDDNPRLKRIPPPNADVNTVYMCRQVYDFKLKRILKNPS